MWRHFSTFFPYLRIELSRRVMEPWLIMLLNRVLSFYFIAWWWKDHWPRQLTTQIKIGMKQQKKKRLLPPPKILSPDKSSQTHYPRRQSSQNHSLIPSIWFNKPRTLIVRSYKKRMSHFHLNLTKPHFRPFCLIGFHCSLYPYLISLQTTPHNTMNIMTISHTMNNQHKMTWKRYSPICSFLK